MQKELGTVLLDLGPCSMNIPGQALPIVVQPPIEILGDWANLAKGFPPKLQLGGVGLLSVLACVKEVGFGLGFDRFDVDGGGEVSEVGEVLFQMGPDFAYQQG